MTCALYGFSDATGWSANFEALSQQAFTPPNQSREQSTGCPTTLRSPATVHKGR